jgi:hypothetical protein
MDSSAIIYGSQFSFKYPSSLPLGESVLLYGEMRGGQYGEGQYDEGGEYGDGEWNMGMGREIWE